MLRANRDRRGGREDRSHSRGCTPGHPARVPSLAEAGLPAVALVRSSQDLAITVLRVGRRLAAYSCGNSAGVANNDAPAWLRAAAPGEPRWNCVCQARNVNWSLIG